jgi:catalase
MTADIDDLAHRIHDMLRSAPTSSPTHRALHAKGMVVLGTFTPSGGLADLTTASHLVAGTTSATIRFSHPAGNPTVSDTVPSARGMAVKLRTAGAAHDLVGVSMPAFYVHDGTSFLELTAARAPDPTTGVPDPDKMLAFVLAHPESRPAIEAVLAARVPASYSSLVYNGLHTFLLVDEEGVRHPFRWSWVPVGGEAFLDEPDVDGLDLASELADRLATRAADADFDLLIHLGQPGDPTGDPTAVWPERPTVVAGRLELVAPAGDVEPIIFDPNNVTDGLALPDDDQILQLRKSVYGLSYAERTSH